MTDEELAAHGVSIEVTPRGVYFVSVNGWGRKVGSCPTKARMYAENLVRKGLRQP